MRASSLHSSSVSAPWPDSNSPVLSKIDFGVPLPELLKWLCIRNTFLGLNGKQQDIPTALALARDCRHPDAVWLTFICNDMVLIKKEVRESFLAIENDARSLCFAWWLTEDCDRDSCLSLIRKAADMGYSFACSSWCGELWNCEQEGVFSLAQRTAACHECDGYFWLGACYEEGVGCDQDLALAKENYLIAAELGHGFCAGYLGNLLDKLDPARWLWWGRAASLGFRRWFLSFSEQVENFYSGVGSATVMFLIGRALEGNFDVGKNEIFGCAFRHDLFGSANRAVSFYAAQSRSARLAVDTWTLVSTRLHLIKDIRIFIGKMIWEARFEGNYFFEFDLLDDQENDDDENEV